MAPVIYTDDTSMDHKEQLFEASILHRIPTELLIESSSSTPYFQSFPNGQAYRSWLSHRRKYGKEERLRKLAKFHAELLGKSVENETTCGDEERFSGDDSSNNTESNTDATQNSMVDQNELLLDITLRTMVLLHHNQQLQNRLTALQMETRDFVRSCLSNTEANCTNSKKCD